jgi:hypothetical protein
VPTIVKLGRKKKEDVIAWAKAQGACATADRGPSWGRRGAVTGLNLANHSQR